MLIYLYFHLWMFSDSSVIFFHGVSASMSISTQNFSFLHHLEDMLQAGVAFGSHELLQTSSQSGSSSTPVEQAWDEDSTARIYERSRIKALADEREEVQKKTFTKWVNSHLQRVTCRILDLYMDLRDGRMLIKLLEVLCGEALPKPTRGKMRIHSLENVDKTLQFLKDQKVHLENMGSHDIVDGNHRLTLGLIWTIILRFQIQDISIETEDNTEKKSAKDALLLWCQMKTKEYSNVRIKNFTTSWRDGLAFNALIHKHRPDLIDFDNLKKSTPEKNLQNAFSVAEQDLGLTKLLDPEDVNLEQPDEKSVMTYVVTYYHYFNKMKALAVEGKRIGKVLDNAIEAEKMANEYDSLASDLLLWIDHTISSLNGREFPNSLGGVQQLLQAFSMYRTTEKPPNFIKKGDLEVLLFTIQSKMRANNQKVFTPRDGKLVGDINRAWEDLERAEHERELALRNELIRQEKLEQLAHRFGRKAALRETWLSENQRLIAQDNFGHDLAAVEAADKKHEAIETDIAAYRERVQAVVAVASELESEQYHDVAQVLEQRDNMQNLWEVLQELLAARRQRLEQHLALQRAFQEMLYIMSWMDEMKGRLQSQDYGKHLLDVEDLLQKHSLLEADITIQAEPVKTVCAAASKFSENGEGYKPCEPNEVQEHVTLLEDEYRELGDLAIARRARLEDSRRLHQFLWDTAEVEVWAREVEPLLASEDIGRDLTGAQRLLTRHEAFEDEMIGRHNRLHQVTAEGQRLVDDGHFGAPQIEKRLADIAQCWAALEKLASKRKQLLEKAVGLYTVQADADDLVGWLSAVSCLASSEDFGHDEASARALDKKHKELHEEVESYRPALSTMNEQLQAVPPEILEETGVAQHVQDLDVQFNTVAGHAAARRKRLDDTLALYTMFSEAEACDLWIDEKGKWLHSLQIPDTLEDLEVMQHRFETLEPEMNGIASRIGIVNDLANRLLQDEHPSEAEIKCKSDNLNSRWKDFCDMLEKKKDGLHSTLRLKNFKLDSHETKMWIKDKTRVIESTQDLGNDLAGVMALQRKLSGMERDLSAIESKLSDLQAEAEGLAMKHPDQAAEIIAQLEDIQEAWAELKETLRNREESLGEATKLQKFLQDVDDFQAWLSKTQRDIASEDLQVSPDEMEMLLRQHEAIKNEIDNSQDDFHHIQDMGKVVTQDQTDPQYMFLQQRLQALDSGWDDLNKMWDNQHRMLSQTHAYTSFIHDAHQAEGILSNQEYVLGRVEMPKTLEVAEVAIKKHEGFLKTMDTNEEKIISVMDSGRTLIAEQNPNSNKIQETIDSIDERHTRNRAAAKDALTQFKDNKTLQTFLQHCQDLKLWIDEKMLTAQDMSYDEARDLHSKWQKHQAFTAEMSSNKEWLDKVDDVSSESNLELFKILKIFCFLINYHGITTL
uniref:Spectrin beta chain, non-erythrocytic 2 n=1 Tax=Eptatretus burgeri TaxID=7764 RepID=A0A8C4RBP7_EPTBU